MGRGPKYVDIIEQLLRDGYNVKDIVDKTNIGKSTVYDVLSKMKERARRNFKELMTEDYLWKYENTLDNFDRTIREMNEEINLVKEKYTLIESKIELQLSGTVDKQAMVKSQLLANLISCQSSRTNELIKLAAQRDKASDMKAKVYNAGPVVHAIDAWVNQGAPAMGDQPRIPELDNNDKTFSLARPNINEPDDTTLPSRLNNTESNNIDLQHNKPTQADIDTLKEMAEDE